MDCSGLWPFRLLTREGPQLHEPTPETRLSMSSGRVGGETHSEVADMAVAVDRFLRRTVTDASSMSPSSPSAATLKYKPHLILSGHNKAISSVKFSPDGNLLASAGVSLSASLSTYLQTL
jgi:WD40 repeat protein